MCTGTLQYTVRHADTVDNDTLLCMTRYEGTGRSLSLKLIQQLRQQSVTFGTGPTSAVGEMSVSGRSVVDSKN